MLANNAGSSGPTATVDWMSPDELEKGIQINLKGAFQSQRLFQ